MVHVSPNYCVFTWGHGSPEPIRICFLEFHAYGSTRANIAPACNIKILHEQTCIRTGLFNSNSLEPDFSACGKEELSWLNVHQAPAQCWWSIMKAAEIFHSLWGGSKNWWLGYIMNSYWPAAAAAASIHLADSQLRILGRASPNKRFYKEPRKGISRNGKFLFSLLGMASLTSSYRHLTLYATRVNMMLFTFAWPVSEVTCRLPLGHRSHSCELKPRRIHTFRSLNGSQMNTGLCYKNSST